MRRYFCDRCEKDISEDEISFTVVIETEEREICSKCYTEWCKVVDGFFIASVYSH